MYSTKLTFPQSVDIRGEKLTYTTLGGEFFTSVLERQL